MVISEVQWEKKKLGDTIESLTVITFSAVYVTAIICTLSQLSLIIPDTLPYHIITGFNSVHSSAVRLWKGKLDNAELAEVSNQRALSLCGNSTERWVTAPPRLLICSTIATDLTIFFVLFCFSFCAHARRSLAITIEVFAHCVITCRNTRYKEGRETKAEPWRSCQNSDWISGSRISGNFNIFFLALWIF